MNAAPQALTMSSQVTPSHVSVRFVGRMDAEGVRQISEPFERVTSKKCPVVIDLTEVTFLESLGVALLVRLAKRLHAERLSVAVIPGQGAVARILGIARLDKILNVVFTHEQALEVLGVKTA